MYTPVVFEQESKRGHTLLSALLTILVFGLIVAVFLEIIFFSGGFYNQGQAPLVTGEIDTPVVIYLAITLLLHPLFTLPSLIASAFYVRTILKGFFYSSLLLNIISFVYECIIWICFVNSWLVTTFERFG